MAFSFTRYIPEFKQDRLPIDGIIGALSEEKARAASPGSKMCDDDLQSEYSGSGHNIVNSSPLLLTPSSHYPSVPQLEHAALNNVNRPKSRPRRQARSSVRQELQDSPASLLPLPPPELPFYPSPVPSRSLLGPG